MAVKSADPRRPPRGGFRQKLVDPKVTAMAISGWATANCSRPYVSGSWPDHGPASGANGWNRCGNVMPMFTPPAGSSL